MKKEDLIALGIEEDVAKQVMVLHGTQMTTLNGQISALTAERDGLKDQVATNQTELDSLKESAKGNEDLTNQLADLQAKLDQAKSDADARLAEQKKDFAIQLALKEADALDEDIVLGLLDKDTIKVGDDGLQGFNEQVEKLKESKPFLFQKEDSTETTPNIFTGGNAKGGNSGKENDAFANAVNKF